MDRDKTTNKLSDGISPARSGVQRFEFEELDDATVGYLRRARESHGRDMPGIFAPKTNYLPFVGLVIGIALLVLGCIATLPPGPFDEPVKTAFLQMAFLLPGAWMIIAAIRVWAGASRSAGYFVYADACRLYECDGSTVKVIELAGLVDADGIHNYNEGKYQNTTITLRLDKGKQTVTVHEEEPGRQLIVFLKCIAMLDTSEWRNQPAGIRSGMARQYARTGQMTTPINESDLAVAQIPEPARTGTARSGILAYVFIIVVAIGGVFLLIPIDRDLRDDNIFEAVTAPGHGGPKDLRAYLIAVPDGKHREEIENRLAVQYQAPLNALRAAAQKSDLAKGPLEIVEGIKTVKYPGVSIRVRETNEAKQAGELFADTTVVVRRNAVQKRITDALTQVVGIDRIDFAELKADELKAMIEVSYRVIPDKDGGKGYQIELTAAFRKRPDDPEIVSKQLLPVKSGPAAADLQNAVDEATRALLRDAGLPENPIVPPAPVLPNDF